MILAFAIQFFSKFILMLFYYILKYVMKHLVFVLESLPKVFGNDYNKIILILSELKKTLNIIDQYEWN